MIYVQLSNRAKLELGQSLHLGDAAKLIGPHGVENLRLPCPDQQGIWKLTALHVTKALQAAYPDDAITLMGADVCYVHRVKALRRDPTRPLRTAAAFLILCLGGTLGLCWFHADVDMPRAQFAVYEALTGEKPRDSRLITIPYAAGVALGVAVFYALPSRRATTPLEVKLTEYQSDMEQTEARDID
ncbi:MAG: hypothetical protein E7318_11835 [Clostridiales bacterium]|nr:hypothetical protein [Clostridiales bacterium]